MIIIFSSGIQDISTKKVEAYLKANPSELLDIDLEKVAAENFGSQGLNPIWGYSSQQQMLDEAKLNYRPPRLAKIPVDFVYEE